MAETPPDAALLALIDRLRTTPPVSPEALAAATGVALAHTGPGIAEQAAATVGRDSIGFIRVEHRTIPAGGALMVVMLGAPCLARATVETRYGPLEVTDVPRSGHPDEETVFARAEPWGELRFGFAQRRPQCLSSLVLKVAPRG